MEERNENVMTIEENVNTNTEVEATYEEPAEETGKVDLGAIALGLTVVVGGVAAILHFTKEKREARKEARLAKQGYVKLQPGEMIVRAEVEDEEDSEDAVETEDEK